MLAHTMPVAIDASARPRDCAPRVLPLEVMERLVEIEGLAHTHLLRMIAVNDNVDILSLQGSQLSPHVLDRLGVAWIDPFEHVLTRYEKSLDIFHDVPSEETPPQSL